MNFRIVPRFEKSQYLVTLSQTVHGKLFLLALFTAELYAFSSLYRTTPWLEICSILLVISLFPDKRNMLVLAGTVFLSIVHSPVRWHYLETVDEASFSINNDGVSFPFAATCVLIVLVFFYGYLNAVKKWRNNIAFSKPIITLFLLYSLLLIFASYVPLPTGASSLLWGVSLVLGHYFWFFGYTLLDSRSKKTTPFYQQLGHYHPFWGSTLVPFPKGAAYLRKIEAKTSEKLAITQIKAIKLLTWVLILLLMNKLYGAMVYSESGKLGSLISTLMGTNLDLPKFNEVKLAYQESRNYPPVVALLSLAASYFESILSITIWSGAIVACARMAGYNALRNTYNPLFARSIADFWNRYYYYFKELLVDFFFYPAFLRYFKDRPRLRLFAATMSAAFLGNFLFHFYENIDNIIAEGFFSALGNYHVYLFYTFVLGTAIGVSQIRNEGKVLSDQSTLQRIINFFAIFTFFSFLHIFDAPDRTWSLVDYFFFLSSMLGFS